jgi:hypothetical protein
MSTTLHCTLEWMMMGCECVLCAGDVLLYVGVVECSCNDLVGSIIDEDTADRHLLIIQSQPSLNQRDRGMEG